MADDDLLTLIDRLEAVLAGSELDELEVEVGRTALRLRRLGATDPRAAELAAAVAGQGALDLDARSGGRGAATETDLPGAGRQSAEAEAPPHHQVLAPLTGIYYGSPSPEAAPYIEIGAEIQAGQVIGLIEAMKLFNEIKSDVRGRVVRIVAENGQLIKARQPLIEVAPA